MRFPLRHISTDSPFAIIRRVLLHFRGPKFSSYLLLAATTWPAIAAPRAPEPRHPALAADYGRVPLSFEENRGQAAAKVRFVSRGDGYSLLLSKTEAVLALRRTTNSAGQPSIPAASGHRPKPAHVSPMVDIIRMQLVGANRHVQVRGADKLLGTANYFIGNDPLKWHTSVPTYQKINYRDIYPGIDLIYYGNQRQLEYDYVVAPGADPNQIRIHFQGSEKLSIEQSGDLSVVTHDGGEIVFKAPVIYQMIDGKRHEIVGGFTLRANNSIGFSHAEYDHSAPLVLDPTLSYSTFLGNGDYGTAIAVDSSGNAYVTGTTPVGFPTTPGAFQASSTGGPLSDPIFVTKINPAGTALVYSTLLGGSATAYDYPMSITVDSAGDAYVAGIAYSTNFPTTSGAFQTVNKGGPNQVANGFVTKLNPSGTALVYSTYLGGSGVAADAGSGFLATPTGGDGCSSIAIDSSGNAVVAGQAWSTDFPVANGAFQATNRGGSAGLPTGFVSKLNANGSSLIYSTYLGGSQGDGVSGVALDPSGDAYAAGGTLSTDFPVTSGAYQSTNRAAANGFTNAFLTKLNPAGSALLYSTYIGGSGNPGGPPQSNNGDIALSTAVDSAGNAYLFGITLSGDFPVTSGAFQTANKAFATNAGPNFFATKIDTVQNKLIYSTYVGGSTADLSQGSSGMSVDGLGDLYFTGSTLDTDYPVTPNALQPANKCASHLLSNVVLTELNPAGTSLVYSTYFGGSGYSFTNNPISAYFCDIGYGLAIDSLGGAYLAGMAASPDFPISTGAYQSQKTGEMSAYIAKLVLGSPGTTIPTSTKIVASVNPQTVGAQVTFTATVSPASGNLTPTGTVTFSVDGGASTSESLNASGQAAYVTSSLTVGSHTIAASYSGDSNHSASSGTVTETINGNATAASIAVVSGSGQTTSYGSAFANPLLVIAKDSSGNPVAGAVILSSGAGLSFSSPSAITGTNGQASVTASATASGTLTATASTAGVGTAAKFSLTASKAPLTVTAVSVTVAYNQAIPALTYATAGFVNGDSSSVLTGSPSETSTAKQGSAPGTYPITITQGTLTAQDYTFKFVNGTLTINGLGTAAVPTFSPGAGTFASAQTVTISDSTAGALIYYTTDGTTPTSASQQYSSAISVPASETIKAFATAPGYSPSAVSIAAYTIDISPPTFTLAASPAIASVSTSKSAKLSVTVTPENGFAQSIGFTCSGLPAGYQCAFSPASITPSGSPASSVLTISTTSSARGGGSTLWIPVGSAPLFALVLWPRRRRWLTQSIALVLVALVAAVALGCGSKSKSRQYTVTVTASGGTVSQTAQVNLTVSQ